MVGLWWRTTTPSCGHPSNGGECGMWMLVVGYNHPVLRTPLQWRGTRHVDGWWFGTTTPSCGHPSTSASLSINSGGECGMWMLVVGFFACVCAGQSPIAIPKAPTCAGWQLYPAAQRGVQATARDPKPHEVDESPIAQRYGAKKKSLMRVHWALWVWGVA